MVCCSIWQKKVSFSPKIFERNFSQIRFKALGQINSHLLLALFTDSLHLFKCHSNLWRKTMKLRGRRRVVLVRIFHPKININPDTIDWGGDRGLIAVRFFGIFIN